MSRGSTPMSTTISAMYLMTEGHWLSRLLNSSGATRVHLMQNERSQCGSITVGTDVTRIPLAEAISLNAWCYSCLGNALECVEKGAA